MKVVIQRVKQASVSIEDKLAGSIQLGLMVLLGIESADTIEDVQWLSNKIVQMRLFDDAEGVMNLSVKEIGGNVLLISQFTLHASTKKGNRPSYIAAAKHDISIPLYEAMIKQLSTDMGAPIQTGVFGADMQVALINNGPVTIIVDSKNKA